MSKVVKIVGGTLLAAVGTITGIVPLAYAGAALAAGTAIQAVGGLLTKKPMTSPSQGDRTKVSLQLDAPRKIVFGHTALGTDLRWQYAWGAEQEYVSQVLVVASHWCDAIEQVWLNDQLGWSLASGTTSSFAGYFFVSHAAQAVPGSGYNDGSGSAWGNNAAFVGCATIHLQFRVLGLNDKAGGPFSASIPTRITIRGRGAPVYDPRLDDIAGGVGGQRVSDQSTWVFAPGGVEAGRNPALCLLFYLLGWRIQDPTTGAWKLAVGCGIPAERIDLDSFITAANQCDEPIALTLGGSEPRYRCDGMFSEADDPGQVITALETSMNAKLRDSGGRFRLQVYHNDLAVPVLDLTADDVLGDFAWQAGGALNELKNVVKGRYTDASDASLYQLVDYPSNGSRLPSLDGIDRIETFDLALVQSPSQAQRLAKQRLQRYQFPGTFAAEFKARAWAVRDGDVVRLTFPALGMDHKPFRVAKATIQVSGVVPLVLVEESDAIYAWDASESPAVVAAPPATYNPLLEPLRLAIDDAAETAEWTKVGDAAGKRPDDNATRNVPRGEWDASVAYIQGDIVTYSGSSYIAGENVPVGTYPTDAAYWDQLAIGGDGIPGPAGKDGTSSYVHLAYANSADGSQDFVAGAANPGRTYIGVYTDGIVAGSSDYHAYNWSRLTGQNGPAGTNGTPGPVGPDGRQSYVHFAYADSINGQLNFTTGDPGSRSFIGVYSDYTVPDSNDPSVYVWSLIRGADGSPGPQGNTGSIGATGGTGPVGAAGSNGVDGLAALNIHTVGSTTWDGHNLICQTRVGNWNSNGAYSANVIPGGVAISFQRPNWYDPNEDAFVGLSSTPSASLDYQGVEFAWRQGKNTGFGSTYSAEVWHAGALLYNEAWDGGNTYAIRYDSNNGVVTWYRNNQAVCTYGAGSGKSYGVQVASLGTMSAVNLAFTAAGGIGATGGAGPTGGKGDKGDTGLTGPPGTSGVSPSPRYPAVNVGYGTVAYGSPIPVDNGVTLTFEIDTLLRVSADSGTGQAQAQMSLDNGSTWSVMTNGSSSASVGDADSVAELYVAGTYANSSGARQVAFLRSVITSPDNPNIIVRGTGQPR